MAEPEHLSPGNILQYEGNSNNGVPRYIVLYLEDVKDDRGRFSAIVLDPKKYNWKAGDEDIFVGKHFWPYTGEITPEMHIIIKQYFPEMYEMALEVKEPFKVKGPLTLIRK